MNFATPEKVFVFFKCVNRFCARAFPLGSFFLDTCVIGGKQRSILLCLYCNLGVGSFSIYCTLSVFLVRLYWVPGTVVVLQGGGGGIPSHWLKI